MNAPADLDNASAEVLMGQVVDEFLERINRGEQPDVESYVRRYPQLAAVLRQMLPALQLMRVPVGEPAPTGDLLAGSSPLAGTLGDYRLLREVGRGGMGVVYEAEQISLGRRVALKMLPFAAALDDRQLQRFKNEAHAAAHLHHQNIVPVYGVGHERGVHYYAMQFIEGQTLAAVIQDLRRLEGRDSKDEPAAVPQVTGPYTPSPPGPEAPPVQPPTQAALTTERSAKNPAFFRKAAQLGVQAAEALEHAHQLGVLHRDIKPANLLVDVRGNLWITDFGLAQVQSDTRLTLTGDILGTLRYMSPEQALAKRVQVDHRTDVYSLGVTLYELVTLEPACDGQDREDVLRQIAFEEPKPPRHRNRAIPVELETIILKAVAKNPAERYATAQELADDLRRFLEDKTIRAKRPTVVQRLAKWGRRHRGVLGTLAISTAVALVVVTVVALIGYWRTSAALEREATARRQADRARATSEAVNNFLVKEMLTAADPERAQGRTVSVKEILDAASVKVGTAFPDQPEVEADLRHTIGASYRSIGRYTDAEPHLARALRIRRELFGEEHPDSLSSMAQFAELLRDQTKLAEAESLFRKVLETPPPGPGG
jgi:serine/threonine protein kinase